MKRDVTSLIHEHYGITNDVDEYTQEGLIRGLASEFEDIGDDFGAFVDMAHYSRDAISPRIKKVLLKIRKLLKNRELAIPPGSGNGLLKFRQGWARWRFYFILNDKIYKDSLDYIEKTGKDPVGYVSVDFKSRIIPGMYNAKSSKDLEKLVDLYEQRTDEILELWKKNPTNNGYGPFLRQAMYGLRDLVIAIRRLVTYNS